MVLASNKLLSNSGDDQKSSEVVTSSSSPSSSSTLSLNNDPTKANIADAVLLEANLMSTTKAADTPSGSGRTAEEEILTTEAASEPGTIVAADNANQNEGVQLVFADQQQQELEEQHRLSFSNILKAMATDNKNSSDYSINESLTFQSDLETARSTVPSTGVIEKGNEGELENNNHTYNALIDDTFNIMIGTTGLDSDTTDTNINMLNVDSTMKSLSTLTSTAPDDNLGSLDGMLNKVDRSAFLNTLTIGGNITNANTLHNININNINTNANAAISTNKPVNPVYALDAPRPPTLNVVNNGINKNMHISNGDAGALVTTTNGQAEIILYCEQSSHPFQTRTILLTPNIECKVGRLIAKCKASESNAIFDCKVLSRNHAVLWYSDDGKFWVKDTKSSNGTFINDIKLGNVAAELHYGDIVKFGVDVLENLRKEVHGCIIASVKLYLPDGRQAISIDSNSQRLQYSGESRISFDDLHRLNVYMQETSQREKALKSKLYNIQNLLDATRKNSSTCWQAMISEDQLLHRIHSLEKKIQILEKNMPENTLKSEIVKLIDDKSAYQHSAKEALRSVYLERCEALQKLAKLESDFTTSDNECKILRDQITCTEEALQDVNDRMRLLEAESSSYRPEMEREKKEMQVHFEERIFELAEKLQQRDQECELLRARISEVSQKKRKGSHGEEENLQKQAIENLDAVIAGMDMGDDEDDDEEDAVDEDVSMALLKLRQQKQQQNIKSDDVYDCNGSSGSSESSANEKGDFKHDKPSENRFVGGEATIMKWLKNSDLNTKEGSMDIFNAICNNDSDSSDEQETISPEAGSDITGKELKRRYTKLEIKLQGLRQHIQQLEVEIEENSANNLTTETKKDIDDDIKREFEPEAAKENAANDQMHQNANEERNKKLKKTVYTLNEAFEEICDNFKVLRAAVALKQKQTTATGTPTKRQNVRSISKSSSESITSLPEINEIDDEHDSEEDFDDVLAINCGEAKKLTKQTTVVGTANITKDNSVDSFVTEIKELKAKLNERDRDSQQMLEMLQIECDTHKTKVNELLRLTDRLRRDQDSEDHRLRGNDMLLNAAIKSAIPNDDVSGDGVSSDSGVSSVDKTTETATHFVADASVNTSTTSEGISEIESTAVAATAAAFEHQMQEELAAMNSSVVQREEELIAYKESLEKYEKENMKLRNDLHLIRNGPEGINNPALMRTAIPMGIAVIGVLAYLVITYF